MKRDFAAADSENDEIVWTGGFMPDLQLTLVAMKREGLITDALAGAIVDRVRGTPDSFGKYRLDAKLGEGGMGEVWKAWQADLGRWVALKFIKGSDPEDVARFVREAQMAAKLSHPNIVSTHEAGELDGKHFISMDYVEGDDLKKIRVPVKRALELMRDAALAVQFAHEQGIVHRDIKPQNLMMSKQGRVLVMDFGLARSAAAPSGLSVSGTIVGTPAYMAPEQARGEKVDARADVYSLGATLYELVTGHPPFEGETVLEVLRKVNEEDPTPPRKLNAKLNRDVETIVLKCLEKAAVKRYATAKDLADDIDRDLRGEPIAARPINTIGRIVKKARRNNPAAALIGVLLLLVAGTAIGLSVNSIARARDLTRWTKTAEAALSAGRWEEAGQVARRALALAPEDGKLQKLAGAADLMVRAADATRREEAARRKLAGLKMPEVESYAPASKRELLWQAEDERDRTALLTRETEFEREQAALGALARHDDLAAAKAVVAEIAYRRWEQALPTGDAVEIGWWEKRALEFGGKEYERRIKAPVTVALSTNPFGANAYLFKYVEVKRLLIPMPCSAKGELRRIDGPSVDALPWDAAEADKKRVREGTAYPLTFLDANAVTFPLMLAPGSYLVVFRKDGFADARYPLKVERNGRVEATVELVKPEEIPSGFVYAPGGPFIAGADPQAHDQTGGERPTKTDLRPSVAGFFIQKFSVTCGEYLEYLNDKPWHEAQRIDPMMRAPRSGSQLHPYWKFEKGSFVMVSWSADEPVYLISYFNAVDYAAWYTKKHGEGKWKFELPTEDEWEKAARGVDGRFLPWGDRFDPSFCGSQYSRKAVASRLSVLERIGLFAADESPFGVRDMAGVIRNWTSTGVQDGLYLIKGGSWGTNATWCNAANRYGSEPTWVNGGDGLRLAARRISEDF